VILRKRNLGAVLLFLVSIVMNISAKGVLDMNAKEPQVTISEDNELLPIEIVAKEYFLDLQPWKEGMLATVDGWGRFSEMTFHKGDKYKVTPLVKFPKMQMDKDVRAWPDHNLFFAHNGKMMFVADVESKKTKDFIPFLTWVYRENVPVLLDGDEGLLLFQYKDVDDGTFKNIYYNYKTDEQYEDEEKGNVRILWSFEKDVVMTYRVEADRTQVHAFYNWRTKEFFTNKLIDTLNTNRFYNPGGTETFQFITKPGIFFSTSKTLPGFYKITWNEDYSEVDVLPVSYLLPKGKSFSSFYLSKDGKWATVFITGYKGLYGEDIARRVFFHLDARYPGGISMPIFADGYEEDNWMYGAFFNHPEYGPCYAHEYYKEDQQYLRLYKMSDVVTLINQKLLDTASEVVKK